MSEPQGVVIGKRFEVRSHLGSGGFGEVYEAYDRQRAEVVALKILRRADAAALYRFKQEFRTLADVVHRNLVTLYELATEGDHWLLTMELIRGVNFVDYVRDRSPGAAEDKPPGSTRGFYSDTATSLGPELEPTALPDDDPLPIETLNLDRVRAGLRELAVGVRTLHQHGVLHLDIKPSNVLVTAEGRVVLVDFGLAARLGPRDKWQGRGQQVLGTPEFMSPEQASAEPPSAASDWYCVGALLYRALTGVAAFRGPVQQILHDKLNSDPPPPSTLVPELPEDLDRLCQELMRRDPAQRPTTDDVLLRLGSPAESPAKARAAAASEKSMFVGRRAHLAELNAAFEKMRLGQTAAVYVHGESGMGKTALVRRFLEQLHEVDPNVVVLEGRCYEHEAMPFKAFDSIVDALSDHLRRLPDSTVIPLLPPSVGALARVFPVLQRVEAIASARERSGDIADVHELRRRAFSALREFFARVADRQPLVLFIDDLQWGDVDSAALLDELLRPPDAPPLLLIASYRSDEEDTSPCLRALLMSERARGADSAARRIAVSELRPDEAEELALALMPTAAAQSRASVVARESHGNPLFIDQLSRAGDQDITQDTLDNVLWNRTLLLPPSSRHLLEVIAVAGSPIPLGVAAKAANVESGKYDVLASLRAAKFVRSRSADDVIEVETYHDRIRETIVAHLSDDTRRQHHQHLALALEPLRTTDPEALVVHFKAAGDLRKAASYAIAAAEKAANALAFDSAARLYSLALEIEPDPTRRDSLYVKLGDALAMCGRVLESARAYLEALDAAGDREQRLDLRRKAGEQYLLGGHLEEGIGLLRSVLGEMGMGLPASHGRAFVAFVLRSLYLRLRGLHFRERRESEIPKVDLQRLDTCMVVCRGLGFTDSMRAIELQTRHLLLALKAGEPYRVARALTFSATADGVRARTRPRAERLLETARALAQRDGNAHIMGLVHSTTGLVRLAGGRFREAVPEFDAAEVIFRERGTTLPYEILLCYIYRLESLYLAGALKEYFRAIPEYLSVCQGRGDILAEANFRLRNAHRRCFADDDVAGAREELRSAEASWRGQKLPLALANLLFREIELAHYAGDAHLAWELMTSRWQILSPLQLFGFQGMTTQAFERRAYCALGMAALAVERGESPDRFLSVAEQSARTLDRWRAPWGAAVAHLVRAGIAAERGKRELAIERLAMADRGFRDVGMSLHLMITRWRHGSLIGGDQGRAMVEASKAWMIDQGIRNPNRMSQVVAPGRWTL